MRALLAFLLLARTAAAHIVPIPPANCRFDPIELSIPGAGVAGTAAAATAADTVRIVFDTGAGDAVFCPAAADPAVCGDAVPRAFTMDGTDGTLVLSSRFAAAMLGSGDLVTPPLPLVLTVGATTVNTAVTLTTGLVSVGDSVVSGAPIAGFGTLTLVGVASGTGLPAPVAGQDLLLRLSCQLTPNPDKDQFASAARVVSIGGPIAAGISRLRVVLELNPFTTLSLAARPLRLQLTADDTPIGGVVIPDGLVAKGRRFSGTNGTSAVVAQRRGTTRLILTATVRDLALPALAGGARLVLGLTIDGGGLLTRGERLYQVSRNGRLLHPE